MTTNLDYMPTLTSNSAARMCGFASGLEQLEDVPGIYPFDIRALVDWVIDEPGWDEDILDTLVRDKKVPAIFLIWLFSNCFNPEGRETRVMAEFRGEPGTYNDKVMRIADSLSLRDLSEDFNDTRAAIAAWLVNPWYPETADAAPLEGRRARKEHVPAKKTVERAT